MSSATTRLRRPGAATCSSCTVDARLMRGTGCMGIGGPSASRPSLMKTTRCSVTWHPEQMNVWCSIPRTGTVSSGTTFVRISSTPQAVQRITCTPSRTRTKRLTVSGSIAVGHPTPRYHIRVWTAPAPGGPRWPQETLGVVSAGNQAQPYSVHPATTPDQLSTAQYLA